MNFELKKIAFDVKQNTDKDIHNFEYLISGETFGSSSTPNQIAQRIEPSTPSPIYYGNAYAQRKEELKFLIPDGANPVNKVILPQVDPTGPDIINFNNYVNTDILDIYFNINNTETKKGGGVIRDSNYPPPHGLLPNSHFDQVNLSSDFKIKSLVLERNSSSAQIYNANIILSVTNPNNYYKYNGYEVISFGSSDEKSLLLFVENDSTGNNNTINCSNISIDFSNTNNTPIPILIWYGQATTSISWPLQMRKKGLLLF